MNNLIRKYKISKILDIPLEGIDKEIIDFIKSKIDGLIIFQENYEINFMNSGGECILQQDEKNDRLWVLYEGFWSILETKYLLKQYEIQIIIKGMVELAFKMRVSTPI